MTPQWPDPIPVSRAEMDRMYTNDLERFGCVVQGFAMYRCVDTGRVYPLPLETTDDPR